MFSEAPKSKRASSASIAFRSGRRLFFLYFKLSIAHTDIHYITRLCNARDYTAIVFSRHHSIAARKDSQWIQGGESLLHSLHVRGL